MTAPLPHLISLGDFAETYFPGEKIPTVDGLAVTCPACHTESSLRLRDLFGRLAASCFAPDCPGNIAEALGMSDTRWLTLLDTVRTDSAPASETPTTTGGKDGDGRLSADDVVTWIEANYRLGRSTDGLLFAVPTYPGSNRIAREVRSIRSDVLRRFREDRKARTGKGVVIGSETMTNALNVVAALAEDAQEHPEPVAIRAAQVGDDRIVLDLGQPSGRLVEATPSGWRSVEPSADLPLFRRSASIQPLPDPERGGAMDDLRDLLGLTADDRRWKLVRGWLVGALFAEVPRPILWATGSQGSGKSTRTKMILSLIEPTESLGKEPGRNERDDSTAARGRFLVSYDNITTVSQNTSDWLCRLVTGVTDDRRALYTDDDLRPVSYRRSGVATSITLPPGLGSDALERIVLLPLDRVPDDQRRGEAVLWAAFESMKPKLLGALLDDVVRVLRHLEDVKRESSQRPRMADYGDILLALDRGLGLPDDAGHLAAYVGTVDESLAERALDDPFTAAVLALIEERRGHWRGTADDLLQLVNRAAGSSFDLPPWWPRSPRALTGQLERAQEALRHAGVVYTKGKSNGSRWIDLAGTVTRPTVPVGGTVASLTDPATRPTVPVDAPVRRGRGTVGTVRDGLPGGHSPSPICSPDEKEGEGTETDPAPLLTRTTVPTVPEPIQAPSLDDLPA